MECPPFERFTFTGEILSAVVNMYLAILFSD